MITTIQISEELKNEIASLKISPKETYEDVIKKTLKTYRDVEGEFNTKLREAYEKYAKDDLEITKEWEKVDVDWEE